MNSSDGSRFIGTLNISGTTGSTMLTVIRLFNFQPCSRPAAATNATLGQWVFFDWVPARHIRIDSGTDQGHFPNIGAQTASPARGQGQSLLGTYNFENPQPNSHFETLDPCKISVESKSRTSINHRQHSMSDLKNSSVWERYLRYTRTNVMANNTTGLFCPIHRAGWDDYDELQ